MKNYINLNQQYTLRILSLSLAAVFFLYEFFLRVFPGTLSKLLITQFHLNASQLALLSSGYYAAYALLQIPIGYFMGQFGVKKVLMIALLVCVIGNALFIFSVSYGLLFFSRILMGIGSSAAFPGMLIIARDFFSYKFYGFFAGMTQILGGIGPILAGVPLVIAVQRYHDHWQIPLLFVFGIGCILLVLTFLFFTEKTDIARENVSVCKISEQLRYLLSNKKVRLIALYALVTYAVIPLFGATWGVFYLQTIGLSHVKAAFVISSMWFGLAIGSPLVGYFSDFINRRKEVLIFCSFLAMLATLFILYIPINYFSLLILFFILGVAGAAQTLSFVLLELFVPKNLYPCAVGINNTAIMLGGIVVPLLVGFGFNLIKYFKVTGLVYSAFYFKILFSVVPLLLTIGLITAVIYIPGNNKIKFYEIGKNYGTV